MMKNRRIRIKDIAEEAKVSRGTVDRVIHNRGKVAPHVKDEVEKAIKSLGYSPNIIARTLAQNKNYHIATLIPHPDDVFWELPQVGIQRAYEATKDFGIHIDQFFFRMDDAKSFQRESANLLKSAPDAVLMTTEFYREAITFYERIEPRNIPMVGINTHLKELEKVSYVGQDSYQSGVLAGRLFDISLKGKADILIIHLGSSVDNAMHIMDKERGLSDYFQDRTDQVRIIREEFGDYKDLDKFSSFLGQIFRRENNIRGIFVTNSRAHYLIKAKDRLGITDDLCIVGFDLVEENCVLLRSGAINFLINQDPIRQGNQGILTLVDQLLFNKARAPISYLPLDIVVPENVDMYIKHNEGLMSEVKSGVFLGN